MGSPLSPIKTDLVLLQMEKNVMVNSNYDVPVYFKYVDDKFLFISVDKIEYTLHTLNSHFKFQFTLENPNTTRNYNYFLDIIIIFIG